MMMSLNTSQEKSKLLMTHYYMKKNIEDEFFHTWSYLHLCATAGIVINDKKFKFCRDTVEFASLNLTPNGVAPSDHILSAIKNFHKPTDLTNVQSWFGLVNQIAWAYSISPITEPFRQLH